MRARGCFERLSDDRSHTYAACALGTKVAKGPVRAAMKPRDKRKVNPMRSTVIHRVLVATNLPPHVPDQIKYGEAVQAGLANNPHFPLPDPIIAAFVVALGNYSASETAAQTRAKGTIAQRNADKVVFVGAVHAVKARVQVVADANPEQAAAIITSTGLSVKKTSARQKQTFAVKSGVTSGTVDVVAKAAAARASYEWQYSVDAGKTWVQVSNTLQAKTTIIGLPVAVTVEFRYRATTKAGMGDWSLPTSLLVR